MAGIEAVLWDFGGVFVPSPFSHLAGFASELGTSGDVVLELVFGPYDRDTDHPWHRLERGEIGFDECNAALIAAAADHGVEIDPLALLMQMGGDGARIVRDDVVAVAQRVRADGRYRSAVITNNARDFRDAWRNLVDIDAICEVVIDSSEVGVRKPDPRIFELALERLGGVAPDRAAFLDDAPGNVAAAAALGIHAIRVEDDHGPALAELEVLLAR